ncbi:Protein SPEAR3, partial [Cucurbita argyrosperma subsp. argyrosperma]
MGSGYFGEMNMGNIDKRRSGSPAAAVAGRRGRKGGGGEKPKQPQRGLGVAQLEKIRLHGEMGCAGYGHFYPNLSAGMGEYERGSFRYGDSQPTTTSIRWNMSNTTLETQHFGEPNMTGHLSNPRVLDSMYKNMNTKYGSDSIGSSSQNSESSESHELDLELRLSI